MAQDNRPLSPHLQVYRPQLTMVLSILHRLTGVMLSLGALVLVSWLTAATAGPEVYSAFIRYLSAPAGLIIIAALSFCLFYHTLNGIRHLVWDSVRWFELKEVYATGWTVVIAALALTAWLWWYLLFAARSGS